jgi:hypothetical protein
LEIEAHLHSSVGQKTLFASKPCVTPISCVIIPSINQIADLKMEPLIHNSTKNDCCYDKNVIVSIADFLVKIFFIVMVITDFLFQFLW